MVISHFFYCKHENFLRSIYVISPVLYNSKQHFQHFFIFFYYLNQIFVYSCMCIFFHNISGNCWCESINIFLKVPHKVYWSNTLCAKMLVTSNVLGICSVLFISENKIFHKILIYLLYICKCYTIFKKSIP